MSPRLKKLANEQLARKAPKEYWHCPCKVIHGIRYRAIGDTDTRAVLKQYRNDIKACRLFSFAGVTRKSAAWNIGKLAVLEEILFGTLDTPAMRVRAVNKALAKLKRNPLILREAF